MSPTVFSCRFCASDFFESFFRGSPSGDGGRDSCGKAGYKQRGMPEMSPEQQLQARVRRMVRRARPRAKKYFSEEELEQVMTLLAMNIDPGDVLESADADRCIRWRGDVVKGDVLIPADGPVKVLNLASSLKSPAVGEYAVEEPVLPLVKPGNTEEGLIYVSRVVAYMFASDDVLLQLQKEPQKPFKMRCGHQLCVNMKHVDVGVADSDVTGTGTD